MWEGWTEGGGKGRMRTERGEKRGKNNEEEEVGRKRGERKRERGSIGSEVLGRSASGCRLSAEAKSHMKHT